MINKVKAIVACCLGCIALFVACDSGDIEDKEYTSSSKGQAVKVTATISGLSTWGSGYNVALAGFREGSNYAVMQQTIQSSLADGEQVELVLGNLTGQVATVEFSVTNRLRERIVTLARVQLADYSDTQDTIQLDLGAVDVSMFGALQQGVFNMACIQCHGGNGRSAASLNLTEGNAYANLVDVPSTRKEGMKRVESGNASQSLLHQILAEGGADILHYNHTEVLSSQFKDNHDGVLGLIDDWINRLKADI